MTRRNIFTVSGYPFVILLMALSVLLIMAGNPGKVIAPPSDDSSMSPSPEDSTTVGGAPNPNPANLPLCSSVVTTNCKDPSTGGYVYEYDPPSTFIDEAEDMSTAPDVNPP